MKNKPVFRDAGYKTPTDVTHFHIKDISNYIKNNQNK